MRIISVAEARENGIDLTLLEKHFINDDCEEFVAVYFGEIVSDENDEVYELFESLNEEGYIMRIGDFIKLEFEGVKELINPIDDDTWGEIELKEKYEFIMSCECNVDTNKILIETIHKQIKNLVVDTIDLKMEKLQKCKSVAVKFL